MTHGQRGMETIVSNISYIAGKIVFNYSERTQQKLNQETPQVEWSRKKVCGLPMFNTSLYAFTPLATNNLESAVHYTGTVIEKITNYFLKLNLVS